jgi:hypothetical protein
VVVEGSSKYLLIHCGVTTPTLPPLFVQSDCLFVSTSVCNVARTSVSAWSIHNATQCDIHVLLFTPVFCFSIISIPQLSKHGSVLLLDKRIDDLVFHIFTSFICENKCICVNIWLHFHMALVSSLYNISFPSNHTYKDNAGFYDTDGFSYNIQGFYRINPKEPQYP